MMDTQVLLLTLVAVAVCLLLFVGLKISRTDDKLTVIHDLVNSRLSKALDEKERLEGEVEQLGGPMAPPHRDPDGK